MFSQSHFLHSFSNSATDGSSENVVRLQIKVLKLIRKREAYSARERASLAMCLYVDQCRARNANAIGSDRRSGVLQKSSASSGISSFINYIR